MASRGIELGRRFKLALDDQALQREREEQERKRRLAEAREARKLLLGDLAAFGQEVGHLTVKTRGDGLVLRYGERSVTLEPMGGGDRIKVRFDGQGEGEHRLYREPALQLRWVYAVRTSHGADNRVLLFDDGLEELMVTALGLPRPSR